MSYITSDFRLTFADNNFIWAAAPRPGLPILRWPDGSLCEPVLCYFGYSAKIKRTGAISSLKTEGFSVREWLVFLANKGLDLYAGCDDLLEEWRTIQGWIVVNRNIHPRSKLKRSEQVTNARIQRKLHHIFEFYRLLPKAVPFDKFGRATPQFVGNAGEVGSPINAKYVFNKRTRRRYLVWERAEKVKVAIKVPKVPDKSELSVLYAQLRGKAFRVQQRLRLLSPPVDEQILAERDFLMAKTMADAGLRCEEVSEMMPAKIANALWKFGITNTVLNLEALSGNAEAQFELKRRVLSIKDGSEIAFVLVSFMGKGKKERAAPFPPSLICDILQFIWTFRTQQIRRWALDGQADVLPLFLSNQSRDALLPNSIGGIIGTAYRACHLRGSAHKLRGHFGTLMAASLWKEYFALNQYRFDQALVNKLLDQLARFMGHEQVTTTVKFYLDKELFKQLTRIGSSEAKLFHQLWDLLVMQRRKISERQSEVILKMTRLISESTDDSRLIAALEILMNDKRFVITPKTAGTSLSLVGGSEES